MFLNLRSPRANGCRAVFLKRWFIGGSLLLLSLGAAARATHAAPLLQTSTPTPTQTLPALPQPPEDGGVVAVETLPVYGGPGESFAELGGLPYGAFVYPEARSPNGVWMQIDYAGFEGWVYRPLVDMAFDPFALPVAQELITPLPGGTPSPVAATFTPTAEPSASPTALPDEATVAPSPTEATQEAEEVAIAQVASTTPEATEMIDDGGSDSSVSGEGVSSARPGRLFLIGAGVLGVLASAWYLLAGRSTGLLQRGEFVLSTCPACREGSLSLESRGRSRHVVRCDNCRSVLRRAGGDAWRYAVDPLPDKEFAERYNEKVLSEEELVELSSARAREAASR